VRRPDAVEHSTPGGYVPALDGVRALAVAAVLVYHGGFSWAPGGFLGVDVFFVLSGFLITGLLVGEVDRTGTLRLGNFWARRARRLLPALIAMLLAVGLYALWLAPPGSLGQLRRDALSTLFYVANWNQVFSGQGYFAGLQSASPSPLLHTWSLAIEEQFYLLWPLIVLGLVRLRRSRTWLLGLSLTGAVASAVAMAAMYHDGLGVDRVFYGTDTRAQDLLIGAALALVTARLRSSRALRATVGEGEVPSKRWARRALVVAGGAGLGFVLYAMAQVQSSDAWLYRGGFALVSLSAAAALACVVLVPSSPWARALSLRAVRYVGRISYGIYLWHWPLFVALDPARTHLGGLELFALRVAATLVVSVASYHLLEMPIRRGGLRRWGARVLTPASVGATAAVIVLTTAGVPAAAGALGGVVTSAAAPEIPSDVYSVPPGVSSGTATRVPAVPASTGGPIRFLLVGSSEAAFMAFGLAPGAQDYGVEFANDSVINCGLLLSPSLFMGQPSNMLVGFRGAIQASDEVRCSTQLERWRNDVQAFHPDVVALEEGQLETRGHLVDGSWAYLGQSVLDRMELRALEQAVSVLGSTGATVELLTAPYYHQPSAQPDGRPWPEDAPALVDTFDRLLADVAAKDPGRVVVEPLGARLDPGGKYASQIGGQAMRLDGIHLTVAAGRYVQPWLLPKVVALGMSERARAEAESQNATTATTAR